jgi:hypothetical protein
MAVKQGEVILVYPNHRDNRFTLELPFARHDYSLSIQGSLQLANISRRKAEAGRFFMSPCSCNLASKRRWEGATFSDS